MRKPNDLPPHFGVPRGSEGSRAPRGRWARTAPNAPLSYYAKPGAASVSTRTPLPAKDFNLGPHRGRVRRFGWLLLACLGLSAAPCAASPRVTLSVEGASLHQVLRRLHMHTALNFTTSEGAGNEAFPDPPGGKRITASWSDEPLGRVLRQICEQFGLRAVSNGDSGYWFQPGPPPKRVESSSSGIAFALGAMSQQENVNALAGEAAPQVQRSLQIALVCRALDGEGDAIAGLTDVRVLDAGGKQREARIALSPYDWSPLPDERTRSIQLDWEGEQPARLSRLEGNLAVYSRVEERRLTVPVVGTTFPLEQDLGGLRVKVSRMKREGRALEVHAQLQWPEASEVAHQGAGAVRAFAKLDSGKYQRLYGSIQPARENQGRSIALTLQGQFEGPPVAFELRIPVRSGPMRAVPFRFDNIVLPFGRPLALRTTPLNQQVVETGNSSMGLAAPPGLSDPDGGMLVVKPPAALIAGDEVAVGLSHRNPDGTWSPFRWLSTPHPGADIKIERLKVGRYRVRLRAAPRRPGIAPIDQSFEAQVTAVRRGGAAPPRKE